VKSQRYARIAAILTIAALVVACAGKTSQTYVDRVARAKEIPNAPYSNILIVAIAQRGATAREFEEVLAAELTDMGINANGYHRAASRADVKEEVVRQLVTELESDAIIFVTGSFVGAQREVTGSRTELQSQVKGGGLVDFFRYDYEEAKTPAKTDYRVNVQFTSDMFDVETEERIYTVESRTDLAETTSEIILAEAQELARRLRKDRLVR
jgi:predicted ester cyclase